jgi:Na+/melibiose symporter-like transporter
MSQQGQAALVIVNSIIPCVLGLLAVVPLMLYPISGTIQKRVRSAIELRNKRDGLKKRGMSNGLLFGVTTQQASVAPLNG